MSVQYLMQNGAGAFVAKLKADGSALEYSTYLGGVGTSVTGLVVDSSGTAYVTGSTGTQGVGFFEGFQVTPDALPSPSSTGNAAFLAKLVRSASVLNYATLLGGSSNDGGAAVAVDNTGNAYLTGFTNSTNFPTTAGAFQTTYDSPPAELIPTYLSVISQNFACEVQFPGYSVFVNLMVNSDSNGPAPTGTVSFNGSFEVGEYGIPVTPATGGTATVQLIGTSSDEVAQSASWTAVYSGDSRYAGSTLSGVTTGPGNCDSQPYVSRPGAKSHSSQSQVPLPILQPKNQLNPISGFANSNNLPTIDKASQAAKSAASVGGSNAFISKFALAAEANQTAYPAPPSIGTSLSVSPSISVDCIGNDFTVNVSGTLNTNAYGPPPTGT